MAALYAMMVVSKTTKSTEMIVRGFCSRRCYEPSMVNSRSVGVDGWIERYF